MESYYLGDSSICWSFGKIIDVKLNLKVLYMYKKLKESSVVKQLGIFDIVPSFNAIAVYFEPLTSNPRIIEKEITDLLEDLNKNYDGLLDTKRKEIKIPVVYDGIDLERVAKLHKITPSKVIKLHSESLYQVAMIGFKPHFPYLIGLDPLLETPRLDNPRNKVPAGSVAIGGSQTGIYPIESPGGWNIIGRTDPKLLESIKPGDLIKMLRSDSL